MRKLVALLVTSVALWSMAAPAAASPPDGACTNPDPARPVISQLPWAQQLFDLGRVWPYSTGAGITVAVVDSGVDADHPQLRGVVDAGRDFYLVGSLPGNYDCASHGTAVASIIAAQPKVGIGFAGVAPGARILPVRVVANAQSDSGESTPIDPNIVGKGIRYAADQGADIINLSLSGSGNYPQIRDAIRYAQSKDALVVAAVGNRQSQAPGSISFPAAYPGVVGVGSIDIDGARDNDSQVGSFVSLVAPGKGVVAANSVNGHRYWEGTSFAAPFVSGAAALVRAAWPKLNAQQVAQRLIATASVARGGTKSPQYGAGIVDPYRAVTDGLDGKPRTLAPVTISPPDPKKVSEQRFWWQAGAGAKIATGAAVLAVVLVGIMAWLLPRGKRRRWRSGRTTPPAARAAREEPPEQIFLFPVK
ncbi:type VII secretion-associated serine protease mycosin [Fodinicola acaciae]|uniref:type VII secretion-associated serine protease mycosin n=1 Tax=Fodinicola acaciae TaxID=2681555 RepID=UPI0013D324C2|nr:type VII secretion-associated serine protease mycosin [Fodinicola acaciae]